MNETKFGDLRFTCKKVKTTPCLIGNIRVVWLFLAGFLSRTVAGPQLYHQSLTHSITHSFNKAQMDTKRLLFNASHCKYHGVLTRRCFSWLDNRYQTSILVTFLFLTNSYTGNFTLDVTPDMFVLPKESSIDVYSAYTSPEDYFLDQLAISEEYTEENATTPECIVGGDNVQLTILEHDVDVSTTNILATYSG